MTTSEKIARQLFKDLEPLACTLYERWRDECEYEDLADYAVNIKPEIEKAGGTFLRMTRRPFGFQFKVGFFVYAVTVTFDKSRLTRIA